MKPSFKLRAFLLSCISLLVAPALHAANGTWTSTTAGPFNWSSVGSWSGGTVADGVGFTAFFTSNITAEQTAALDSVRSIGNITFTDSTSSTNNLTISNNGNAANILTLDVTTGAPIIDVTQSGRRLTISAQIAGNDGLTKNGLGIVHLTNNNSSYTGATTVNAGMLDFGGIANANIGGGVAAGRNITVASGAAVRFNAVSNALLNRIVETSDEIIIMTGGTANSFDFSSSTGANLSGAFLSNYASNGAKAELTGTITPGGGAYRLGSLLGNGALGITNTSPLSGANQLIIGGNRVVLVGAKTFTGDTTIRDGGRLGLAGLNTDAGAAKNNSLALQNSVLDLGAPAATGQIFLESGVTAGFITGATSTANGGTTSATFGGLKGSRDLNSAFLFTAPGNNTSATVASGITGFTLNPGTGVTVTYSGAIGGFGAGATGSTGGNSTLTKTGAGTQILAGTNTYTGATTVSAGTLLVNGSLSASSSVAVNGGTFGGTGAVGGPVTVAATATFAPGASIESLATGSLVLQANSTYAYEINNDAAGAVAGDLTAVTGGLTLDLANAANLSLIELGAGSWSVGEKLTLISYTGSWNGGLFNFGGTVSDDSTISFSGMTWLFDYDDANPGTNFTGDLTGSSFVTMTAIPEPRAALLGGLGLLALLRRRRK